MSLRDEYLQATTTLEVGHPRIRELTDRIVGDASSNEESSRRLFYWVRDEIRYCYHVPFFHRDHYRATSILDRGEGFCVQKALLLATLARSGGIPARLLYCDIRNHRVPEATLQELGTNLFVYHSYVEWWIAGRWIRVTPTFDQELCRSLGYPLVEYDGRSSAIFPPADRSGRPFVEYVAHHGDYADLPLDEVLSAWEEARMTRLES
jgi:transglutaminase-like putative cysteine protease